MVDVLKSGASGLNNIISGVEKSILEWDPTRGGYYYPVLGIFQVDLTALASQIRAALLETDPEVAREIAQRALISTMPAIDFGQIVGTATQVATSLIGTITGFFSTLVMGLLLSLLILLEAPRYQQRVFESGSEPIQREIRLLGVKVMNVWQGFFRGQLLLCAIIGLITFIQLLVMGAPSAAPLALLVAVISLIPTIGGLLALIPLGLLPFLQGSTVFTNMDKSTFAFLVVGVNLIISQIIWNVIAPKIMGDAVALPLPIILVGIIIGTALGGALGAFLIVPILGTIRVVVLYLIAKVSRRDPFPGETLPEMAELSKL
jgi:predicted PurR-regulated permease PerM